MGYILSFSSGNASKTPNILTVPGSVSRSFGLRRFCVRRRAAVSARRCPAGTHPSKPRAADLRAGRDGLSRGDLGHGQPIDRRHVRGSRQDRRARRAACLLSRCRRMSQASPWFADRTSWSSQMSAIRCEAGVTKIARVLEHIRAEHRAKRSAPRCSSATRARSRRRTRCRGGRTGRASVLFSGRRRRGDPPRSARPILADHHSQTVEAVLRRIALLTGGAWARFDAGAAAKLAELLAAVAAFAVGGIKALGDLRSEEARASC